MKYKYEAATNGVLKDAEAPIVGKELVRIEKESGLITPAKVVDEARPKTSTLHEYFTWGNAQAADKYRLWEARQLIASVIIVRVTDTPGEDKKEIRVRAFTNVQPEEDEKRFDTQGYRSTVKVMKEKDYREQALARGLSELLGWKSRYEHLKEFSKVVTAIETLELAEAA